MTPEMIILFVLFNILLLVIIGGFYIAFDYKNAIRSFIISKTKWVSRFFKTIYYSHILPQYKIHLVDGFYYPMFKVTSAFTRIKGLMVKYTHGFIIGMKTICQFDIPI